MIWQGGSLNAQCTVHAISGTCLCQAPHLHKKNNGSNSNLIQDYVSSSLVFDTVFSYRIECIQFTINSSVDQKQTKFFIFYFKSYLLLTLQNEQTIYKLTTALKKKNYAPKAYEV